MTGLKTGVVAVVLVGSYAASAQAQGVVPGGWAPQFGYQSFGGMAVGFGNGGISNGVGFGAVSPYGNVGFGNFGGGVSPYGMGMGVSPYGMGAGLPFNQGGLPGMTAPMPMTTNASGSLINAIRQTTRRSTRR